MIVSLRWIFECFILGWIWGSGEILQLSPSLKRRG
jgi:hypothetical protein